MDIQGKIWVVILYIFGCKGNSIAEPFFNYTNLTRHIKTFCLEYDTSHIFEYERIKKFP